MATHKTLFLVFSWITWAMVAGVNGQESSPDKDPAETAESSETLEQVLAGHSQHGEAFNKGPRQEAYLIGGTGTVQFPCSCQTPEVQSYINQGVGQLHGFWDLEAERTFRQAFALDPDCAMAYWGAALATTRDQKRAQGFIAKAMELKDKVTPREQMYIEAVNKFVADKPEEKKKRASQYLKDLESIVLEYPDDLEAKALVAHRIWENGRAGIPIASYVATNALLNKIFEQEPLHPSHHYAIHLWDYRNPKMALNSAARCGLSAPSIAHMWHMPGHIYSRLKRYEDAVYQQEASARVDHAYMMRDQVMPDEISNFAHNNEWLIRNLVFIGRAHDALDLAKNMVSLPRHPEYNILDKKRGSHSYGRKRLLQVLREFQMHDQAVGLCQTPYLDIPEKTEEQLKTWRTLACSAALGGHPDLSQQTVENIETLQREQQQQVDTLKPRIEQLEKLSKPEKDLSSIPAEARLEPEAAKKELAEKKKELSGAERLVGQCTKALQAVEGYRAVAEGKHAEAVKKLEKASGEDASWIAELKFLSGDRKGGLKKLREEIKRRKNETIPQSRLVYVLSQLPKKDRERKNLAREFERLRGMSSSIDLEIELFQRLNPVAQSIGLEPDQWLKAPRLATDIGFRPQLDTLGPFRWEPPQAAYWELPDSNNVQVSSAEFKGKPHILIFYLGHGCLHCAEQLQAFAPRIDDFREQGVEIVAISSDPTSELANDLKNFNGEMPYRWHLSDGSHEIFKQFRAYDDFEEQPLHATLLIDSLGRVRWQDISYQPFMDHEFLMKETARLLSQETTPDEVQVSGRTR
ncbi:MAG: peroxiredoxin family protein [Mariniblastus sp.]|nr:peroxiredoxin family protein [Mariniblastus sp.]